MRTDLVEWAMETDTRFEGKELRRQCFVWFISHTAMPATMFIRIESWGK